MDEYMSSRGVWGLTCTNSPEEIGHARRWTRRLLRGHPRADDAELITSELTTNALRHTASGDPGGSFHLTIKVTDRALTITVTDQGSTDNAPRVRRPADDSTQGRGLDIVTSLADGISLSGDHHGRTITAVLRTQPAAGRTPSTPGDLVYGYRCECRTLRPATGGTPAVVTMSDTTEAQQAIRWIRRYVTTLLTTVDTTTRDHLAHWIETDHAKALDDLQRGQPCTLATSYAGTRLEWTARPVIYLPLLPPLGKPTINYAVTCTFANRHTKPPRSA